MHTGDDFFDSNEFQEILRQYSDSPTSLDADDLTSVADYYAFINNAEESAKAINLARSMYPEATAPLAYMAHDALSIRDIERAEALTESISDKSDLEYKLLHTEILVTQDKINEAEEMLQNILTTLEDSRQEDLMIDAVNIYLENERYDHAAKWIERNAKCQRLEYKEQKAKVLLGMGKIKESITIFNELIDHDPYSPKYWNALATAQFVTGDYPAAVNSANYTLAIDPDNPEGLFTKGNALYHQGMFEDALPVYEHYTRVEPEDILGHLNTGTCLVNLGNYKKAIDILERIAKSSHALPDQKAMILQELAFAYSADEQTKKALDTITRAEAIPYEHADLLILKGHILFSVGKQEEAISLFLNVLKAHNDDPQLFLRIAVSIYDNGFPETTYMLLKYLFDEQGDNIIDGYSYMALCCHKLKKVKEFCHYLVKALESNPQEVNSVLGNLFPNGMNAQQYYEFINDKTHLS